MMWVSTSGDVDDRRQRDVRLQAEQEFLDPPSADRQHDGIRFSRRESDEERPERLPRATAKRETAEWAPGKCTDPEGHSEMARSNAS